jgi:histone-lysine N-methyltransferase SETD2
MGITGVNTSFYVAFAFLQRKQESDYTWVLEQLSAAMLGPACPAVVVTDRELVLMNARSVVFPTAKHVLCKWHIENSIKAKCWPFFDKLPTTAAGTPAEQWAQFLSDWCSVVESRSVVEYNRQWQQ